MLHLQSRRPQKTCGQCARHPLPSRCPGMSLYRTTWSRCTASTTTTTKLMMSRCGRRSTRTARQRSPSLPTSTQLNPTLSAWGPRAFTIDGPTLRMPRRPNFSTMVCGFTCLIVWYNEISDEIEYVMLKKLEIVRPTFTVFAVFGRFCWCGV